MTVYVTASIATVEPMMSRRAPNCVSHNVRLRTATGAGVGGTSSASVKYRPISGGASKNPKNEALTIAMMRTRVASPVPTASCRSTYVAVDEKAVENRAMSAFRTYCPPVSRSTPSDVRYR
jgi:hypothetical protein